MRYNPLGQTGLSVSAIGWGTVKLGRTLDVKYPTGFQLPDDHQAKQLLGLTRDLGINLLDTAPAYGISEERLGKLLRGQRQHWIVSTKVGEEFSASHSRFDFTPEAMRLSIERSLRHLCSDYLDLVLVHSDGNDVHLIQELEVFALLDRLKQAGWIRAYGMSTKTLEGGLLAARNADVVMVTYNPHHLEEAPVIDECLRLNKGVLVKKALASGYLPLDNTLNEDPVTTSLQLILGHPGVSSAVIGSINPEHLRENLRKAEAVLAAIQPTNGSNTGG